MDIFNFSGIHPVFIGIFFVLAFLVFWAGIVVLTSRLSRWNKLAEVYPDVTTGGDGEKKMFGGARMNNIANYNGTITFEATSAGLRMKQIIIFRFGHENLLIPWSDIEEKEYLMSTIGFRFTRVPKLKILVSKKMGNWILEKKKQCLR
ncbi:MAG: hypothetical protein ABII02_01230 [Candidatus Magasanikbacteria bacterium]